ncbi:hypothetical protein [Xanthomonas sp. SI]|uniref:hypothetical protein n=1 Tax=Xanthomonas sp. SI TaxID=2724123 RepID=UPI001C8ED230|nr:hypothetical protein [Xanthomonas sp. SI]
MPELLIISGGSEIVGLALAEAAHIAGRNYAVFSLVPHSLLKNAPGCIDFMDLSPLLEDWNALQDGFLKALMHATALAGEKLPIFPTEDGGLRLLNECRDDVLRYGEFSRARALKMGGLDKAELVEFSLKHCASDYLATSIVLDGPEQAILALEKLGPDAIFKPALKPIHMDLSPLGGGGTKVVTRQDHKENASSIVNRLTRAWSVSERWIAQPRLVTGSSQERSVCAVRDTNGYVHANQVVEKAKHPAMGGTAYWVSTEETTDLLSPASNLMEALEIVGICELAHLPDGSGKPHMIELNTRPWLQIGLIESAGVPILDKAILALRGKSLPKESTSAKNHQWVQIERFLMALITGSCPPALALQILGSLTKASTTIAGFGTSSPGIKQRLIRGHLRRIFRTTSK